MKKILIDANIVILFLQGAKNIESLFKEKLKGNEISITPITIHIVSYFCDKPSINYNFDEMIRFFKHVKVLSMSDNIFNVALEISKGQDIEDGMQIATCLENDIDEVYTTDGGLYAKYAKLIQTHLIYD